MSGSCIWGHLSVPRGTRLYFPSDDNRTRSPDQKTKKRNLEFLFYRPPIRNQQEKSPNCWASLLKNGSYHPTEGTVWGQEPNFLPTNSGRYQRKWENPYALQQLLGNTSRGHWPVDLSLQSKVWKEAGKCKASICWYHASQPQRRRKRRTQDSQQRVLDFYIKVPKSPKRIFLLRFLVTRAITL